MPFDSYILDSCGQTQGGLSVDWLVSRGVIGGTPICLEISSKRVATVWE